MGAIEKIKRERVKGVYGFNPEDIGFGVWIWHTGENRITWSEGFSRLLALKRVLSLRLRY